MDHMIYQKQIIEESIKVAGSAAKLARSMGVERTIVSAWRTGRRTMSPKYCIQLAKQYDFVDISKLSPLFDKETINWLRKSNH